MKSRTVGAAAGLLLLALPGCSQLTHSSSPASTPSTQGQPGQQQGGLGQGSSGSQPPGTPPPVSTPGTPTPSTPTRPLSDFTVCVTPVVTCQGEMKTQPEQIVLSGDGTAFVTGLSWTGWGLEGATGSGTLKLDNCNPNCAQGGLTSYVATIVLSDLTLYGNDQQAYAEMDVDAPGSPFGSRKYEHLVP